MCGDCRTGGSTRPARPRYLSCSVVQFREQRISPKQMSVLVPTWIMLLPVVSLALVLQSNLELITNIGAGNNEWMFNGLRSSHSREQTLFNFPLKEYIREFLKLLFWSLFGQQVVNPMNENISYAGAFQNKRPPESKDWPLENLWQIAIKSQISSLFEEFTTSDYWNFFNNVNFYGYCLRRFHTPPSSHILI